MVELRPFLCAQNTNLKTSQSTQELIPGGFMLCCIDCRIYIYKINFRICIPLISLAYGENSTKLLCTYYV
jgi:hypothetical protein